MVLGVKDKKKAQSYESRMDKLRKAIWDSFGSSNKVEAEEDSKPIWDIGVVATFDTTVIVRDFEKEKLFEMEYAETEDSITFGQPKEVEEMYVVKQMMAANPEVSFKDVGNLIDTWDDWAGGFTGCVSALEGKPGIDNPEALCAWMHYQAEGKWPGEKSVKESKPKEIKTIVYQDPRNGKTIVRKQLVNKVELSGPIVEKNKKKRIAYAPVLVPGEKDYDDEEVTKEKVEDACHEWMELYQNIDYKHSLNNVGRPIENYLTYSERVVKTVDGEKMVLPEGTWIIGTKLDEDTFSAVEKGKLKGYSIMGIRRAALKSLNDKDMATALKSMKTGEIDAALKKTLLKDLGPDWVPVSVAVTDSPAVPKSKWFALKEKEEKKPERVIDKIKKAFNSAEKEGRRFSKSTVAKIKALAEDLGALLKEIEKEEYEKLSKVKITKKGGDNMDMTKEQLQEMINEAVKSQVEDQIRPITEEIQKLILPAEKDTGTEEDADDTAEKGAETDKEDGAKKEEVEPENNEEIEVLKSSLAGITDKLDQVGKALNMDYSKSIKGQDTEEKEETAEKDFGERDGFGRKRVKKEEK